MMDALSADFESNNNDELPGKNGRISPIARKSPERPSLVKRLESRLHGPHNNKFEKQLSLQDLFGKRKADKLHALKRGRSNSDGAVGLIETAEAFPSLPNSVLEKLGLYGDGARERLNEESLEQKFTSLALAFTIDSTTIKDRCERQRRSRDQTENNFNLEVKKLTEKLALLKPLCTDFETADLLSVLFSQVETLTKAASLVSIAAERYGAVQHEERLTESVQLMVSHVQALKQQRDSARRQLQYTKRVLQEPVQPSLNTSVPKNFTSVNKKLLNQRRASTDSVNLNSLQSDYSNYKQLNRRTSELSFRASLTKTRPGRLDLGMELNKIKEISPDEGFREEPGKLLEVPVLDVAKDEFDSDFEMNAHVMTFSEQAHQCSNKLFSEISSLVRLKLSSYAEGIHQKLLKMLKKWSGTGYLHAFLTSCAVLCFSISILTLVSIFLEEGYSQSSSLWLFPWINRKD